MPREAGGPMFANSEDDEEGGYPDDQMNSEDGSNSDEYGNEYDDDGYSDDEMQYN